MALAASFETLRLFLVQHKGLVISALLLLFQVTTSPHDQSKPCPELLVPEAETVDAQFPYCYNVELTSATVSQAVKLILRFRGSSQAILYDVPMFQALLRLVQAGSGLDQVNIVMTSCPRLG